MTARRPGYVIYDGPSMLDGVTPILAFLRAPWTRQMNAKLGPKTVVALVIPRDVTPREALRTGQDAAVCGDCRMRPRHGGGCYVRMFPGPEATAYSHRSDPWPAWTDDAAPAYAGRTVRCSEWGDPAAVPIEVWEHLRAVVPAERWISYTHQWRTLDVARWGWCMASVESEAGREAAHAAGWRTFRARRPGTPTLPGEKVCPAAAEAVTADRMTCDGCGLCVGTALRRRDGTNAASIVLDAHGRDARLVFQEPILKSRRLFGLR